MQTRFLHKYIWFGKKIKYPTNSGLQQVNFYQKLKWNMAGVTFIKNKCKTMSRVLRKVVINHRIVLTLSVWGRPSMGQPPKSTFTQQNPILNTQYIYCLHSSYVRVVIETYLGAMQYVKTRSVHMDSEVHLAEGRCDKVSISYQVQLNKVNELLTLFLPSMG